jgi:hypothetical protein
MGDNLEGIYKDVKAAKGQDDISAKGRLHPL